VHRGRAGDAVERAVQRLKGIGIEEKLQLNILTPQSTDREIAQVPTSDTEQPGMGAAVGGVVGGASGMMIGTAVTSLLIPGIGPVVAVGMLASALLGALAGAAAGDALEDSTTEGPPKDEMLLYEDALRQGRTVLIVLAEDDKQAESARLALTESGAESVDAARKAWWIGLHDTEKEHYAV
jgi:outer membrane lipoprotein SlyB